MRLGMDWAGEVQGDEHQHPREMGPEPTDGLSHGTRRKQPHPLGLPYGKILVMGWVHWFYYHTGLV